MFITIKDRPCSKKNSRRNYGHISLPSLGFERFRESALWQLKKYKIYVNEPVTINYVFYQKGKLKQDVDNAIASINDVLQDAGIIENDDLIFAGHFQKIQGAPDWKTEIEIIV